MFLSDFSDEGFDSVDLRMKFWVCFFPAAIEVIACEIRSIVSECNPIHVDHRYHINIVSPKDEFGLGRVPQKIQEYLFSYVRSYSLPWMLPSYDYDNFLLKVVGIIAFDF